MSEQETAGTQRTVGLAEIARTFLKIGAMSYGGPAIMGIMQAEIQEKRQWIPKKDFVEGLALVNMLPGPGATQLGIYIGHAKAGLAGGVVAGLCFILPAFLIMLVLASAYVAFGALPAMRSAFYGIGPVVVGIFAVAVWRLGKGTIKEKSQIAIALAAAAVLALSPLGLVMTLLLAGCAGIALFDTRRNALIALGIVLAGYAVVHAVALLPGAPMAASATAGGASGGAATPSISDVGLLFLKVGAFTFGGGLSMLAFVENQVVTQLGWLTPQEFVDGLALGQLTPGPILMLAAFIGFKLHGVPGAIVGGGAIFLPSFVMMLIVLPLLQRMRNLQWLKAFMRGVAPAVIGALAVALAQMAPHAAPDWFTWVLMLGTVVLMLMRNIGPLPVMLAGGVIGVIARRATAAAAIAAVGAWLSMQAPAQAQRPGAAVDTIVWPGSEPVVYVEPHPESPVATTSGDPAR